jgi:hypothetical protein
MMEGNLATAATENAEKKSQPIAATAFIEALIEERNNWEKGIFQSAMDALYELLGRCVGLYEVMTRDDEDGERLREELASYSKNKGLKFNGKTHTVVKIVRAVFAGSKTRYTVYGKALEIAIRNGVSSKEIANYLRSHHGIDGVLKSDASTAPTGSLQIRAEQVWQSLKETALAAVKSEDLAKVTDQAAIGKRVVLLATQKADGEYAIHEVVKATTVVNTVFASVFSEETHGKVVVEETKAVVKAIEDRDAARAALIAAMAA